MEYQNLPMKAGYLLLIIQISTNKARQIQKIIVNRRTCAMECVNCKKTMAQRNSLESLNDEIYPAFSDSFLIFIKIIIRNQKNYNSIDSI